MEITTKKHESGLTSLHVYSEDTQAVTIMFMVGTGSRYEQYSNRGIAHFVEHTLFKGTEKRPDPKQIGMEIESLGGSTNAFTSFDYTGYFIKSPALNFAENFEILADMFYNSTFQTKEIDKEKGVIVEEIRMYEDKPTSKIYEEWIANFYQDNDLGKPIIGSEESVKNMSREHFVDFRKKHYFPENTLVVIAGNVSAEEVDQKIAKFCGSDAQLITKPEEPLGFKDFEFQASPNRKSQFRIHKDVEQSHVVMGGNGISRNDDKIFVQKVLMTLLGNGFGSRLFQVIRDDLGLAYYVHAGVNSYHETGHYVVRMGVDSQREEEAIAAVIKEFENIKQGKFTKQEFERAKNYILGNLLTDLETSEDVAMFYGMQELLKTKRYTIEETKKEIMAVTLEDIHELAQQYFQPENIFTGIISK